MSTRPPITLLDLPNEILFPILLDSRTSRPAIAQTSRRLNSIITFLFLSEKGINSIETPLPCLHITIKLDFTDPILYHELHRTGHFGVMPSGRNKDDDLSILATAMDITSISELHCKFDPIYIFPEQGYLSHYKRQYIRLALFIQRLTNVRKIVLHLEESNIFGRDKSGAGMHDTWAESLNRLLNGCVGSGCEELEIRRGTWPKNDVKVVFGRDKSRPRIFRLPRINANSRLGKVAVGLGNGIRNVRRKLSGSSEDSTISRKSRFISPTWRGIGWEFKVLTITGPRIREASLSTGTSTPDAPNSNVTKLVIATPSLLLPPHSHWLYQLFTLSPSRITSLTFFNIQLHLSYWEAAFSWIRDTSLHTTLESLTISGCMTLPWAPLVGFINHLKGLKKLRLDSPLLSFQAPWGEPGEGGERRIDLPLLEELLAPQGFVSLLSQKPGIRVEFT